MKNQSKQVKERPIIFSGEMVKAILDGKKMMTRRVVKAQPDFNARYDGVDDDTNHFWEVLDAQGEPTEKYIPILKCPYGKVGDRLWVREAYTVTGWNCDDGSVYIKYLADGHEQYFDNETDEMECAIDSLVTSVCKELDKRKVPMLNDEAYDCSLDENKPRNRSPMFMPRWASRILLEITDIRVERLNDISEADAVKEGMPPSHPSIDRISIQHGFNSFSQSCFAQLWDTLNEKKGYPWSSNPWVWVVEFKVLEGA